MKKALGIVKKIDELGRITIPKELRQSQGWDKGQPMEMFMDGDSLVIKPDGKEAEKKQALADLVRLLASDNEAVKQIARNTIKFLEGESE